MNRAQKRYYAKWIAAKKKPKTTRSNAFLNVHRQVRERRSTFPLRAFLRSLFVSNLLVIKENGYYFIVKTVKKRVSHG